MGTAAGALGSETLSPALAGAPGQVAELHVPGDVVLSGARAPPNSRCQGSQMPGNPGPLWGSGNQVECPLVHWMLWGRGRGGGCCL